MDKVWLSWVLCLIWDLGWLEAGLALVFGWFSARISGCWLSAGNSGLALVCSRFRLREVTWLTYCSATGAEQFSTLLADRVSLSLHDKVSESCRITEFCVNSLEISRNIYRCTTGWDEVSRCTAVVERNSWSSSLYNSLIVSLWHSVKSWSSSPSSNVGTLSHVSTPECCLINLFSNLEIHIMESQLWIMIKNDN